ncbi:MAG: hypothetical protein AB7S38_06760 [Vulcanimicrobiota bacterium]
MQIKPFQTTPSITPRAATNPQPSPEPTQPGDGFEPTTPLPTKIGKWVLTLGAAAGAGALGFYAGTGTGLTHTLAGAAAGGLFGATALGAVGMWADVMGGIMSNSNNSLPAAITGGVLGTAAGAAVGALSANPLAGGILATGAGLAAAGISAALTNIGKK